MTRGTKDTLWPVPGLEDPDTDITYSWRNAFELRHSSHAAGRTNLAVEHSFADWKPFFENHSPPRCPQALPIINHLFRYLCDGHEHCLNREDECTSGCQSSLICPNGKCLLGTKKCDGYDDCGDMSDECDFECALQFHCDNKTCLSLDRFCDGKVDCMNGEDENKDFEG